MINFTFSAAINPATVTVGTRGRKATRWEDDILPVRDAVLEGKLPAGFLAPSDWVVDVVGDTTFDSARKTLTKRVQSVRNRLSKLAKAAPKDARWQGWKLTVLPVAPGDETTARLAVFVGWAPLVGSEDAATVAALSEAEQAHDESSETSESSESDEQVAA